jgi:DNA-binding helix-hairpin-helix protein with protein kinase domain
MSSPRHFKTHAGRPILLAGELGKGGEGIVYEVQGDAKVAAKVYHRDKANERREKIEAIVESEWHKITPSVAFPIDSVYTQSGQFAGFTMARIAGNKPIHDLYSPTSRKTAFPSANFPFLIRTALNIARALASVHATGCVVGDINHSGILIAGNSVATLIDCDSFQVQVGGKAFLCKVGVPDFTPPELQGKRFDQFIRTPNHDAFGLAVVLFNLLFMGRHPFAGRFLGRGDMPLERGIAEYRFAYSARRNETQSEPPPNVPLLADIPPNLAKAFEIAFGQVGTSQSRPKAADWVTLLKQAEGEVIRCRSSQAHQYFRNAAACPWCRMESAYPGFLAFAPRLISVTAATPINLGQLIAAIKNVRDPGMAPDLATTMPAFKGKPSQPTVKITNRAIGVYAAALIGTFLSIALFHLQQPAPVIGLFALVGSVFLAARRSKPEEMALKAIGQATAAWRNVETRWNQAKSNTQFVQVRQEADQLIREMQNLGGEEARQISDLKARQRDVQLTQFLQQFYISKATIKGIGRNRTIVLRSYGIETAADIQQSRIRQISGFGPVIAGSLVAWRTSIERRFVFNPNQSISPADITNIRTAILKKSSHLEVQLRHLLAKLERTSSELSSLRNSLQASAVQIWNALKQTELDKSALMSRFSVQMRLAGVGAVMVIAFVLLNALERAAEATVPVVPRNVERQPNTTNSIANNSTQQTWPSIPRTIQQVPEAQVQGPASIERTQTPLSNTSAAPLSLAPGTTNPETLKSESAVRQEEPGSARKPVLTEGSLPQNSEDITGTANTATVPNLKTSTQQSPPAMQDPRVAAIRPESLSREDIWIMQTRLRELGYLSSAVNGTWNQNTREALREFTIANHLSNFGSWNAEIEEKLGSRGASRAEQAFFGSWFERPCRKTEKTAPIIINSHGAKSSQGGACEFKTIDNEASDWRVGAICTDGKKSWNANIKLTVRSNQLIWSSGRGVSTYYRCN